MTRIVEILVGVGALCGIAGFIITHKLIQVGKKKFGLEEPKE